MRGNSVAAVSPPPAAPKSTSTSILNFDRNSTKVSFTEPATIQAIRELGLTFEDFAFKPLIQFRRPGCDDTVAQLFYTRYEERRQKHIDSVEAKRAQILKSPAYSRAQSRDIPSTAGPEELDTLDDMKHLVISKFRELIKREQKLEKIEQYEQRLSEIIRTKTPQVKQRSPIDFRAESLPKKGPLPPLADDSHDRIEALKRQRIADIEEKAKQREQKAAAVIERSSRRKLATINTHLEKEQRASERRSSWLSKMEEQRQAAEERRRREQEKTQRIIQNRLNLVESANSKTIEKLKVYDERMQALKRPSPDLKRIPTPERAIRVREQAEQHRSSLIERIESKDAAHHARIATIKQEQRLRTAESSVTRTDRMAAAHQRIRAMDYQRELKGDEKLTVFRRIIESQTIQSNHSDRKTALSYKGQVQREKLKGILDSMDSINDSRSIKQIASLLKIDTDTVTEWINSAQTPMC